MAEMKITDALEVAKSLARQFAAFGQLEEACARLTVLLGREEDLTIHVQRLTAERDKLAAAVAELHNDRGQLEKNAVAARVNAGDAEIAARSALEQLNALKGDYQVAKAAQLADLSKGAAALQLLKNKVAEDQAAFDNAKASHATIVADLAAERDGIVKETKALTDQLTALKAHLAPLVA